jgi:hypothetical protein
LSRARKESFCHIASSHHHTPFRALAHKPR